MSLPLRGVQVKTNRQSFSFAQNLGANLAKSLGVRRATRYLYLLLTSAALLALPSLLYICGGQLFSRFVGLA